MTTLAIRPLNSSLQVIAREQLHEDQKEINEHLDLLKEWIKKSNHLHARTNDQFLITFLRGCKYSLEQTKKKIDMFYTLRTHIPELIKDRDPKDDKLHEIIKLGVGLPLPDTENLDSPRVMLMRPGVYDPNKYTVQEVMRVFTMINDILMVEDDNMVVAGKIVIIDLANVSLAHLVNMQPTFMKKTTMMMQEGMPIRQKGVHYINMPRSLEQFFNLLKTFLNEKMKSRIFVHSTMDTLYKVIPRKLMPAEYEGEAGSVKELADVWGKKILSYREYFSDESRLFGVDEKKRIGQPKNSSSLFGLDGTFRQLQFD